METGSGIYCFENILDGKKYVGQAQDLEYRTKRHFGSLKKGKDRCVVLQRAWNFYGKENFIVYTIEICEIDLLDEREIYWIRELHSHVSEWGYNVSLGGDSVMRGRHHTDETKKKLSDGMIGIKKSEEAVQKLVGQKRTDETRKKMSESQRGENHPNFGKHLTESTRQKMSESGMGRVRTEETNNRIFQTRIINKKKLRTSSRYVGVCFDKSRNNWLSYINHNKKTIHIGRYPTEIDAAIAYNKKSLELFGENARLNVIIKDKEDNE